MQSCNRLDGFLPGVRPPVLRWLIFDPLPTPGLPPVVCCRSTRPSQAEKSRPRPELSIGGAKA